MVAITDFFGKGSIDSDHAIATTVKTARTAGATVLEAYDVSKFADDTPVFYVTYKKVTDPVTSEISIIDLVGYKALVNAGANTLTNIETAPGYTDLGNDEDDFIECIPTSYWVNSLINGLLVSLSADGKIKPAAIAETGWDGWLDTNETHTYSSWTSGTRIGVITVPSDATIKYTPGMRYRISQSTGGTKYAIIVAVAATTLTLFFPVGTTLNNEAITSPVFSTESSPFGFDRDPSLWTLETSNSSLVTQNTPTVSVWYNPGTITLAVGVGAWIISYNAVLYGYKAAIVFRAKMTLSTANNTEAYPNISTGGGEESPSGNSVVTSSCFNSAAIKFASSTTLYLNVMSSTATAQAVGIMGSVSNSLVRATCAYL